MREDGLNLNDLRFNNSNRCQEWTGHLNWTLADKMTELCGEVGEAANVIKKLRRIETGAIGNTESQKNDLLSQLKDELGDILICLDLVADAAGIDLSDATIGKFNKTSEKVGLEYKL